MTGPYVQYGSGGPIQGLPPDLQDKLQAITEKIVTLEVRLEATATAKQQAETKLKQAEARITELEAKVFKPDLIKRIATRLRRR